NRFRSGGPNYGGGRGKGQKQAVHHSRDLMRLLEHQAKRLLTGFGLRFTEPRLVVSATEVAAVVTELGTPIVLKVQVPCGGRGKTGGVRFAHTAPEAERAASEMLGSKYQGYKASCIGIEPKVAFRRELYAAVTWDCESKVPLALLSTEGGIDIEHSRAGAVQK